MPDSQDYFIPHLRDLQRRGGAGTFLTPVQAAQAQRVFGNAVTLNGGFAQAERVVPVFGAHARDCYIAAIKLTFRAQDCIGHRDVLGAALALGLERGVLGDILTGQGEAWLVCLPRAACFLCENLTKVGKVGVKATQIPLKELPVPAKNSREIRGTVPSLRLDAVLSEAFALSRGKAEEALRARLVRLNHKELSSGTRQLRAG
ncbi:MAG: hypothetical protein LBB50_05100, partial [Oscillospiraceae bacterium]|nr:hypothetical protein [Oscillospiraceae bacterium]